MNPEAYVWGVPRPDGVVVPVVQYPGGKPWTRNAIELGDDRWASIDVATDEHYAMAAALSERRLRRCSPGSDTYWWHKAVMAEHHRRAAGRPAFVVIDGGAAS